MLLQGFYVKNKSVSFEVDFLKLFKTEQILLIKESDFLQILFQAKIYFRVLFISDKIFFPQAFSNNNDSLALKEDYIFFQGELEVFSRDCTVLKRIFMFLCECMFSIFSSLQPTLVIHSSHLTFTSKGQAAPMLCHYCMQTMSSEFTAKMILI